MEMSNEFHPLANIFPLLEGHGFDELVSDIKAHGVREPIWRYDGRILDGRNRFRAATVAGVECPSREYLGKSPAEFVVSLNLHRRHLSESQRAMVSARLSNMERGQHKSTNPQICGTQVDQAQAADLLNVSVRSTQLARAVLEKTVPEVVEAVDRGDVAVTAAAEIAALPRADQAAVMAKGSAEVKRVAKDLRDAKKATQPTPRTGPKAEAMRAELKAAKERGVSMLETYARLTLTAVRAQDSFTEQERSLLAELMEAIAAATA